ISRSYSRLRSSPSIATWAPFLSVPAKPASFPNATHRCQSERDSQDLASFFQDIFVAREKMAMLVVPATFFSASLPMKPTSVTLLRYIKILLVLPACLGHPERVGAAPKGKELLFWGDRNGGARTGTAR